MKNLKIKDLLESLKAKQDNQIDIVVSSENVTFINGVLNYLDMAINLVSDAAIRELCNRVGLPYSYYSLLAKDGKHPAALNYNVNYWLEFTKKPMLIRTYKRKHTDFESFLDARGILSNKYHIINNYDSVKELIDQISKKKTKDISIAKYIPETNTTRLYLELDINGINLDVSAITGQPGDMAIMGITLVNSELGRSVYQMQPFVRLNGSVNMPLNYTATRVHLGAEIEQGIYDGGIDAVDFTLSTVTDLTADILTRVNKESIELTVKDYYQELKTNVPANPTGAIEDYLKAVGLNESQAVTVLKDYLGGSDKSALAAFSAVSKVISLDGSFDGFEALGKARDSGLYFGKKRIKKNLGL